MGRIDAILAGAALALDIVSVYICPARARHACCSAFNGLFARWFWLRAPSPQRSARNRE